MPTPRILQVNKLYCSCAGFMHIARDLPRVGGVERVVQDIAEGLQHEFNMRVLVCNHHRSASTEVIGGVPIVRAATPITLFSTPLSVQFFSLFRQMVGESDLIHFHSPFPLGDMASTLHDCNGRPIVVSYHFDIVRQRWAMPVYAPILRLLLKRADRIVISTEKMRDHSPHLRHFRDKCVVVPFGVSLEDAARQIEPFPLPAQHFILFLGRLVQYKGVEYLIRAMKEVQIPLIVAGDGPLKNELKSLTRKLGVAERVFFVGSLPKPKINYLYARCELFVLPSITRTEAFGLVQLEAMSFGKPVVNTDIPTGVPDVSPHDLTGLTVPAREPSALAEAINQILTERARYARYSRNAFALAGELSMDRFLDRIRCLYHQLL